MPQKPATREKRARLDTDIAVRNAKPKDKPYRNPIEKGLCLLIHPNGSKYFQYRYKLEGKENLYQVGVYPILSLAQARDKVSKARALVASGLHPTAYEAQKIEKAKEVGVTFQEVAAQWLGIKSEKIAPTTRKKIEETFRANVYPYIGAKAIRTIDNRQVRELLKTMESRGALEYMEKTRAWIRNVFAFALADQLIEANPIPDKDIRLKAHKGEGFPYLKPDDVGAFLRNLAEYHGRDETRLYIRINMMVATRPSELRLAQWDEFDLKKGLWIVPMERMKNRNKMTEAYKVPLSKQTIEALIELHGFSGHSPYLFPHVVGDKPISDGTINKALRGLWQPYRIVTHGFRKTFSTAANESGRFRPDVIEASLAHQVGGTIRATYNLATYLDERRKLAQWYSDYLDEAVQTEHQKETKANGKSNGKMSME